MLIMGGCIRQSASCTFSEYQALELDPTEREYEFYGLNKFVMDDDEQT